MQERKAIGRRGDARIAREAPLAPKKGARRDEHCSSAPLLSFFDNFSLTNNILCAILGP